MTTTDTQAHSLWNKNFSTYWLGIGAAALADACIYIALPFLVLELKDDPQALATTVLLGSLPRFLGPLVGLLADRLPLKVPLLVTGLLRTGIFGGIAFLALTQALSLNLIYAAAFLNGLLTAFVFAAGNVLLPKLVPASQLARANSLLQGVTLGLPLAGYGLAGVLVATIGTALTIASAAPLFLALGVAALVVRFPAPAPKTDVSVLSDLAAGVKFIFGHVILGLSVCLSLFLNCSLSALNVLVPLAMTKLERGAQGYGVFEAVLSGGILIGIVTVSLIANRVKLTQQIGIGLLLLGLGFGILSTGGFVLFIGGAVALGLGLGFTEVASITLLQLIVPDGMRGKIIGTLVAFNAAGLTAGAYFAGQLAERAGIGMIFAVGAAATFMLALLWFVRTASFEPAGEVATNDVAVKPLVP